MFLTIIKTLIALQGGLSPIEKYPENYGPNLQNGDEFDFIVVGAGSAGSMVASRLSEVPEWKVLLLEAGSYPSDLSEIPALVWSLQDTDEDWKYKMEPSKTSCLSLKNNTCKCPRGKSVGGSSSMNLMMYVRSTKYDHERWFEAGNDGWDHNSLVKFYRKFENVHIENNKHYGSTGELHITQYTSARPIRKIISSAYEELGYNEYTENTPIGFRDVLLSVYQGTRQSAAKAFLTPTKQRKNLFLATNSQVIRVLVDRDRLAVHGVEVKIGDQIIKLNARKEVILSAGSINSPHILMNSGIGPKEHLTKMKIEVIKDLKVGENLQDHPAFPLFAGLDHEAVTSLTVLQTISELYQYFANRTGSLSTIDVTNFCSFVNTKNNTNFANIQIVQVVFPQQDPYLLQELLTCVQLPETVKKHLFDYNQNSPFISLIPILLQPRSRGYVRLQNSDPFMKPLIIPNYFSDEGDEDIEDMLDAIKLLKRLMETKSFASCSPKIIDTNIANCQEFIPQSDEFWKCAIRNIAINVYHPVGTCKMGPESDSSAVVDARLKVHGVKGIRVIDGSIMPTITSGNTNAPIIMIGEKGATLIKDDWNNKHDEL